MRYSQWFGVFGKLVCFRFEHEEIAPGVLSLYGPQKAKFLVLVGYCKRIWTVLYKGGKPEKGNLRGSLIYVHCVSLKPSKFKVKFKQSFFFLDTDP